MAKVFDKFGSELKDPETGEFLIKAGSYRATYDYKSRADTIFEKENVRDKTLKKSWDSTTAAHACGKLKKGAA